MLEIYEKDRQLVAYDIHDGFVQTAAAASMGMQAALAAYPSAIRTWPEQVASALQLLQQSLAQVRSLVRGLRPAELEEAGLVAAIGQLVRTRRAAPKSASNGRRRSPSIGSRPRWKCRSSASFRRA